MSYRFRLSCFLRSLVDWMCLIEMAFLMALGTFLSLVTRCISVIWANRVFTVSWNRSFLSCRADTTPVRYVAGCIIGCVKVCEWVSIHV